jgi:hypothetical protein
VLCILPAVAVVEPMLVVLQVLAETVVVQREPLATQEWW